MQLVEDICNAGYQIKHYKSGCITLALNNNDQQETYQQPLIIMPDQLISTWPVSNSVNNGESLTIEDIAFISKAIEPQLAKQKPEVVLLGTGEKFTFIDPAILQPITNLQIGVEVMDTAAACRTYTVLVAEARKVLAALII